LSHAPSFVVWDRVLLCSSGWPWTHRIAQASLKFMPHPPECRDCRYTTPHPAYLCIFLTHLALFFYSIWVMNVQIAINVSSLVKPNHYCNHQIEIKHYFCFTLN
jgi:hypothetical protein